MKRIALVDRGEWVDLRFGLVLERAGRKPELIAAFKRENEAHAYRIERAKAERSVSA